jgi:general secretion pathway protein G
MMKFPNNKSGVSLVELVVTLTILSILAALILPSAQMAAKRTRELELRRNLRMMRTAIDEYHKTWQKLVDDHKMAIVSVDDHGYPKELKTLVEGYDFGQLDKAKMKFLRRIPADPFNPPNPGEEPKWGLRAYAADYDCSGSNCEGDDVFDVFSLSEDTAIDGSKYKDW